MIIYDGLKEDFLKSVENDTIAIQIQENILRKMGRHTPQGEFNSWRNSMQFMYMVMNDQDIPSDAGVAIEYNVPQTAKRVDFMVSGYDSQNKPEMVIVELKQWSELKKVDASDALVETYTGNALRYVVHPSYQAWSYARLISDYNAVVQDMDVKLSPCVFMHNYLRKKNDPVDDAQYNIYTSAAPVFTMGQANNLRAFIKKCVVKGDNKEILYSVDHGKIRPSKSLQDSIASMLKGNKEFTMIDEQKVAYEKILKLAVQCQKDHKKRTVICQGGPGTGKSVIAINLLAGLTQKNQFVQYVSKNSAPRDVYKERLKGAIRRSSVDNMFKGAGTYVSVGSNMIHTLLVDEAHRLTTKSGMMHNQGENQIGEIIHSAMCSVFFIDESQRVTMDDIGSVEQIKEWAWRENSEVTELELVSQFRCNGSNGYLAWVDTLLDIRETANYSLEGLDYDVVVCDSPHELRNKIMEKNKINNRSRVLAGYCWKWPKENRNNPNFCDIQIGDFGMSWNLAGGQAFAIDSNSVNEAGCIHTTQGLEFDYVGVIIGDDLRYENGHIVTDFTKRASTDQSLRGIKKMAKQDIATAKARADEIIKNTYRTLMTRGMKGCYIYCTDKALGEYIRHRLPAQASNAYAMVQEQTLLYVADEMANYGESDE